MLLRNRAPGIESHPATSTSGLEHVPDTAISVLRWLAANRVDFILVGPVARAIRGEKTASGPVAIVAAPYGRNLDRLARALSSAHARVRADLVSGAPRPTPGAETTSAVRLTAEKLLRPERWTLRCGAYDLDLEGHPDSGPRYQELLYEATRCEIAPEAGVEVAAPEDIEYYDHVRRTGTAPEIRVTRAVRDHEIS